MKALIAVLAVLAVLVVVAVCDGRTITVDDDGGADFSTIQAAIDDSDDGDTVLVADGIYTGDGNRDIDFHGKAITVKSENGPETCIIDCNGSESKPHRGFHFHSGEDACSAVIGFTITNGYAPGEDCLLRPPFTCRSCPGGGIRCYESSPRIEHCRIVGNRAEMGGGIYSEEGNPLVTGCTISGNYAQSRGGGMYAENRGPVLTNCTVRGNAPEDIYVLELEGLVTASYCNIEGGWPGTGNIDADPCFADPGYWNPNGTPEDANDDFWVDGDYHLKSQGGRWEPNEGGWTTDGVTSPCIDAGNPMTPIGLEPFPNGGVINMGAYGGTAGASKSWFGEPPCEIVVAGDINGDCNVDFLDFRIMALHWLEGSWPGGAVTTTYVFLPDPNTLTTSGGFDGNGHGSYCIEGQFELTVDSNAGTAWFNRVDADIACGESPCTGCLDALFHMSELVCTDVNEAGIDFVYERNIPSFPYADVHLRVIFMCGPVQLVGGVCDAWYDGYCYHLDAVAVLEP